MKTVAQLLKAKAGGIYSISPAASVLDCVRLLADKGIGAVLVMEGDKLAGIISERDYARKVVLQGKSSKDTMVREIMTSDLVSVTLKQTSDECMALMSTKRIRHLPVVEDSKVMGVLSIGDLVRNIIEEQQIAINELERYIHG